MSHARQTILAYLRHRVVGLKRAIRETRANDNFGKFDV